MAMEKTGEPEEAGEPAHDFFDVLEGIGKAIESGGPGSIPEGINRLALAQKGLAVEYGCARAIQSGKPEALLVLLGCAPKGSKRQALAAQALGWASSAGSINCMEATAMAEPSVLADEAACQGAAVAAAKQAFKTWRYTPIGTRARIFRKYQQLIRERIKPIAALVLRSA